MTAQTATPQPPPPAKPPQITVAGADREFLPAGLEILETPPAPRSIAFMLTICAFAALAIIWSFFGKLDIHAVASGKIEANGRSKVIQPLESGKIVAIDVENGREVVAGARLIQLDPADAIADERSLSDTLAAVRAEVARRRLAVMLAGQAGGGHDAVREAIDFPIETPETIQARERAVLAAEIAQLGDTLKNLDMQLAQRVAFRSRLEMGITAQEGLIQILEERVDVRSETFRKKVGTSINLFDAQEALHKSKVQLTGDRGQLSESDAAMQELRSQKAKLTSQFIADNQTRLADAERKADEIAQQLVKARAKLVRTTLVSPVDGVVQQLAATTIGQVVTTGQQLMLIAPSNSPLQVEALVSNLDIGFIKLGQEAEIKVDSFPFTRFGTIKARVVRVARDAMDEQEAKRQQSNPLAATTPSTAASSAPAGHPQTFVFPVTLALEASSIRVGAADVPLTPGMTVSAEIKTDTRRVIDYLISPIAKVTSEALRER